RSRLSMARAWFSAARNGRSSIDASSCPRSTRWPSWTSTRVSTPLIWGLRTTLLSDWTFPTAVSSRGRSRRSTFATETTTGSVPAAGAAGRTVRHRMSPPNIAMPASTAPTYACDLRVAFIGHRARDIRASTDKTQRTPVRFRTRNETGRLRPSQYFPGIDLPEGEICAARSIVRHGSRGRTLIARVPIASLSGENQDEFRLLAVGAGDLCVGGQRLAVL